MRKKVWLGTWGRTIQSMGRSGLSVLSWGHSPGGPGGHVVGEAQKQQGRWGVGEP